MSASSSRNPASGSAAGGFTLLEVLIAFAILVVCLGVLMRVFAGGLGSLDSSRHHATAVLVARSVMERIGIEFPLAAGRFSGDAGGEYRWQAEVRRSDIAEAVAAGGADYAPYDVTVAVAWRDRPLVSLKTLRLGATSDAANAEPDAAEESVP